MILLTLPVLVVDVPRPAVGAVWETRHTGSEQTFRIHIALDKETEDCNLMSNSADKEKDMKKAALEYHSVGRKGKIEVVPTKPCLTQWDLSLAYTPGVAVPCIEIERDPDLAYEYTNKGNLVGVISNGTAVLGLGNIGPLAGKPVMEGKSVLFKRFAGIDA